MGFPDSRVASVWARNRNDPTLGPLLKLPVASGSFASWSFWYGRRRFKSALRP